MTTNRFHLVGVTHFHRQKQVFFLSTKKISIRSSNIEYCHKIREQKSEKWENMCNSASTFEALMISKKIPIWKDDSLNRKLYFSALETYQSCSNA